MKKIAKQLIFVACLILLITPVLSGCFTGPTPLYRVTLVGGSGGTTEFKIGTRNLVSGSSYAKGSLITISATAHETYTIKAVKADSVTLIAQSETQSDDGVISAIYKYKLVSEVVLTVEFDIKNTFPPPPPLQENCNNCGECSVCLEKIRIKDLALSALNFMLEEVFNDNINAISIITSAITEINTDVPTKPLYLAAIYKLFMDAVIEECDCYSCDVCGLTEVKEQMIFNLINETLELGSNFEKLASIIKAIQQIGVADSGNILIIYQETMAEIGRKFLDELINEIFDGFEKLDIQSGFFKNLDADRDTIMTQVIIPILVRLPEVVLIMHTDFTRGNLLASYLTSALEYFTIAVAQDVVEGGFIIEGKEDAFKLAFIN